VISNEHVTFHIFEHAELFIAWLQVDNATGHSVAQELNISGWL
jgi:hypothetical protein